MHGSFLGLRMLKHRLQNTDTCRYQLHPSHLAAELYRSPGLQSWAGISVPPSQLFEIGGLSSAVIHVPSHCD